MSHDWKLNHADFPSAALVPCDYGDDILFFFFQTMGTGSVIASSTIAAILALTVIAMATWVYVLRRNLKSQQHIEPITASTRTSTAESEPPQDGAP